eukprot:g14946.t1
MVPYLLQAFCCDEGGKDADSKVIMIRRKRVVVGAGAARSSNNLQLHQDEDLFHLGGGGSDAPMGGGGAPAAINADRYALEVSTEVPGAASFFRALLPEAIFDHFARPQEPAPAGGQEQRPEEHEHSSYNQLDTPVGLPFTRHNVHFTLPRILEKAGAAKLHLFQCGMLLLQCACRLEPTTADLMGGAGGGLVAGAGESSSVEQEQRSIYFEVNMTKYSGNIPGAAQNPENEDIGGIMQDS